MSLGHPDWIGACGAYLSGLEASSRRGLVVTVFYGAVFLRGTTSGAVLVLLVVVSGSLEDPGEVRADRRLGHLDVFFVTLIGGVARYERNLDGEGAQRRQQFVA